MSEILLHPCRNPFRQGCSFCRCSKWYCFPGLSRCSALCRSRTPVIIRPGTWAVIILSPRRSPNVQAVGFGRSVLAAQRPACPPFTQRSECPGRCTCLSAHRSHSRLRGTQIQSECKPIAIAAAAATQPPLQTGRRSYNTSLPATSARAAGYFSSIQISGAPVAAIWSSVSSMPTMPTQ